MTRLADIVTRIRRQASEPGWSKSRLAIESGLHPNSLRDLDDPNWAPRFETLRKLEATLDRLSGGEAAPPTRGVEAAG